MQTENGSELGPHSASSTGRTSSKLKIWLNKLTGYQRCHFISSSNPFFFRKKYAANQNILDHFFLLHVLNPDDCACDGKMPHAQLYNSGNYSLGVGIIDMPRTWGASADEARGKMSRKNLCTKTLSNHNVEIPRSMTRICKRTRLWSCSNQMWPIGWWSTSKTSTSRF